VDIEHGAITVVHLPGSVPGGDTTRYGPDERLADAGDAAFSNDGSRLAVAVETTPGELHPHVLEAGGDRPVATLTPFEVGWGSMAFAPDGNRVAVVQSIEDGSRRLALVDVGDGSVERITVAGASPVTLLGWSPDGRTLVSQDRDSLYLY